MGRKAADLTGRKFDRLTVEGPAPSRGRNGCSWCLCVCGTRKVIMNQALLAKKAFTSSCGCLQREKASRRMKENPTRLTHGLSKTREYKILRIMIARCYSPKHKKYHAYGGKGITICDRWLDEENGIFNFMEDMGECPTNRHTIDRKDSTKGYTPENCRWATYSEQNRNIGLKKSNTSGYKGAVFVQSNGKCWRGEIRGDEGARFCLGFYDTKEEAALAYNVASEIIHGEYGVRNVLPPMPAETIKVVTDRVTQKLSDHVE